MIHVFPEIGGTGDNFLRAGLHLGDMFCLDISLFVLRFVELLISS